MSSYAVKLHSKDNIKLATVMYALRYRTSVVNGKVILEPLGNVVMIPVSVAGEYSYTVYIGGNAIATVNHVAYKAICDGRYIGHSQYVFDAIVDGFMMHCLITLLNDYTLRRLVGYTHICDEQQRKHAEDVYTEYVARGNDLGALDASLFMGWRTVLGSGVYCSQLVGRQVEFDSGVLARMDVLTITEPTHILVSHTEDTITMVGALIAIKSNTAIIHPENSLLLQDKVFTMEKIPYCGSSHYEYIVSENGVPVLNMDTRGYEALVNDKPLGDEYLEGCRSLMALTIYGTRTKHFT